MCVVFFKKQVNVWLSNAELATIVKAGYDAIYRYRGTFTRHVCTPSDLLLSFCSYGFYLDVQVPPGDTHWFWVSVPVTLS